MGWQQMAFISDLKQLLIPKAADLMQNPETYQTGQVYSVEGTTSKENGHPYSAEWAHLTYFVYGDEHAENGYKNIIGMDYQGKVYRKSQCWNQWTDWEQLVTLKELDGKADKFYTIFNKNVIQDEDLVGSAFTNKSWCGVGLNLEHAPTSNWLNYLCLDAAATGSDINQVFAIEINGSNPQCYFTNDAKGKKWKQFLFVEDLKERISHPNLLINSDFSNLINTEGKTSYSGKNQYIFDGWLLDSSNGMGTLDKSTARVDLFNNYNSEYIDFTQRLELGIIRAGENYTFSASTQVGNVDVKLIGRTSCSVQITEKLSFIYTAAEKYDAVTLRYTGYSYFVKWAKLEQGLIATKFLPPDRATEIVRCQRYIQKIGGWWEWIATGFVSKTNRVAYFPLVLQSKMRDVPTLEIKNKEQIKVMGGNIHTNIVDLEGFQHASENYYNISFTLPETVSVETERDMVTLYFGENVEFLFRAYL